MSPKCLYQQGSTVYISKNGTIKLTNTESSFCLTLRMRRTSPATSAICTCLVTSSGVAVLCCDVVACLDGVAGGVMNFLASSLAAGKGI